jgi:hypothetical protein
MILWDQPLDPKKLILTLNNYSTTDDYAERVNFIVDKIRKQEQKSGEIEIEVKKDSKTNAVQKKNLNNYKDKYYTMFLAILTLLSAISNFYYCRWLFNHRISNIICWGCSTYYCYGFSTRSR